jgi:hypothetical protein
MLTQVFRRFNWMLGVTFYTVLTGCAEEAHWVKYPVDDVAPNDDSPSKHVRLMISPLRDVRQRVTGNEVLFDAPNETEIDEESYCVNSERGYKADSVGTQISEMLAQHLRKRRSLRAVSVGARVADAYYLNGTLRRYYAAQKSTSVSPTTGVLFGAVGAVVEASSMPEWTPGMISIEIVELGLLDNAGKLVAKLPDIRYNETGKFRAGASCQIIYDNIDEHLKIVFSDYVYRVESAIDNSERASVAAGPR